MSANVDTTLFTNWGQHFPSIESEIVELQPPSILISCEDLENLQSQIQPLRDSDYWGIDIYLETVSFIESLL